MLCQECSYQTCLLLDLLCSLTFMQSATFTNHRVVSEKERQTSSFLSSTSFSTSRFVVTQSLENQSADVQSSLFRTKIANLGINGDSRTTFNCALCDLIAHLTLRWERCRWQDIQIKPPDVFCRWAWTAWHETCSDLLTCAMVLGCTQSRIVSKHELGPDYPSTHFNT